MLVSMNLSNENIIHIKRKDVEYIQFRKLLEYPQITHCITLRKNDLDFGNINTYDSMKNEVEENYKKICNELGLEYKNIVRPRQTHTDNIKRVDKKENLEEMDIYLDYLNDVDAVITDKSKLILSTTYADCIPLLFFDPVKNVIANVHSGWKGTLKTIGKKTVEKMIAEYNCNPQDLICCIGPNIQSCHFEVEEDVNELFSKKFGKKFSKEKENGKYLIDTVAINKTTLQEIGVQEENIIDSKICTVCNNEEFYSYRADNKGEKRFISLININKK